MPALKLTPTKEKSFRFFPTSNLRWRSRVPLRNLRGISLAVSADRSAKPDLTVFQNLTDPTATYPRRVLRARCCCRPRLMRGSLPDLQYGRVSVPCRVAKSASRRGRRERFATPIRRQAQRGDFGMRSDFHTRQRGRGSGRFRLFRRTPPGIWPRSLWSCHFSASNAELLVFPGI